MKAPFISLFVASVAMVGAAKAAVIASTNFDGRTLTTSLVANDTATNLNWTTNGVADPGNLSARQWGGAGQALFNNTALTQNLFAPALNVGNAGDDAQRSWTTTVSLTVLGGFDVTVESVAFDYWAINGSGTQNVARNSDFVVTLFDPTMVSIGEVLINDVVNDIAATTPSSGTPVLLTFATPINLSESGTYTLRIRGGDIDNNETGNHTGIDNLSINGVVIPEPSSLALLALGAMGLLRRRRAV